MYLHGLVRDEIGRKMSKTYGNVIDPLDVMEVYGTDALRFTLLVGATPGNDTNVGVKKVESNRNFANKLWNIGRFMINAITSLHTDSPLPAGEGEHTLADTWISAKLQRLIRDVDRLFQNFQYGEAGRQIYEFIWSDFADWYVEIAKEQMKNEDTRYSTVDTLARVFDISLRLLHPFTPFVTEELWGHLRSALRESSLKDVSNDWPEALIIAKWPEPREVEDWEEAKIAQFTLLQESIRAIRNLRAERNIKPSRKIGAVFVTEHNAPLYEEYLPMISALSSTDLEQTFVHHTGYRPSEAATSLVVGSTNIYLSGMESSEEDKTRLEKELTEAQSHIERLEKLLAGDFANKAPAQLVQKERDKLEGYKETADKIRAQLQ